MNAIQFVVNNLQHKPCRVELSEKEVELDFNVRDKRHKNTISNYIDKLQFVDLCFNQGIERVNLHWNYVK